jgi:hypothetical protein
MDTNAAWQVDLMSVLSSASQAEWPHGRVCVRSAAFIDSIYKDRGTWVIRSITCRVSAESSMDRRCTGPIAFCCDLVSEKKLTSLKDLSLLV